LKQDNYSSHHDTVTAKLYPTSYHIKVNLPLRTRSSFGTV